MEQQQPRQQWRSSIFSTFSRIVALAMPLFGLLTSATQGAASQLDKYYQAGTVVGGMASPTGRPYYACPPGFLRMANSCYRLSTTPATWREAHFQCRDLGAQLAAFERPWEDRTVRRFLNNANLQATERWIGASYDMKSHRWIWAAKGQVATYKSFPRRFVTRDWSWHCLALDPHSRYNWRPRPCMRKNHYLCEMPLHCVVGPVDDVLSNGTIPVLLSGNRCGSRARPNNLKSRRPGSNRRFGSTSERPNKIDETNRDRILSPQNRAEYQEGRGCGKVRDRGRHCGRRGRKQMRVSGNSAVEYQTYHEQFHPIVQTYIPPRRLPRPTPSSRGILSKQDRTYYERLNRDEDASLKKTTYLANRIPSDPQVDRHSYRYRPLTSHNKVELG